MGIEEKLIELYAKVAEFTSADCERICKSKSPTRCCDRQYCFEAMEWARMWGSELETTDHPELPLMGPEGCTAPPHFRPMCSVHHCEVAAFGCKPRDAAWTEKYFKIREAINRLEGPWFDEAEPLNMSSG